MTFLVSSHSLSLNLSLFSFIQEARRVCMPPPHVLEHWTDKLINVQTKFLNVIHTNAVKKIVLVKTLLCKNEWNLNFSTKNSIDLLQC